MSKMRWWENTHLHCGEGVVHYKSFQIIEEVFMTEAGYQDFANHLTLGHHLEITIMFARCHHDGQDCHMETPPKNLSKIHLLKTKK